MPPTVPNGADHDVEREVWTKNECKLLERTSTLLASRGIEIFLGCTDPRCIRNPLRMVRRNADGALILSCSHKTRILEAD